MAGKGKHPNKSTKRLVYENTTNSVALDCKQTKLNEEQKVINATQAKINKARKTNAFYAGRCPFMAACNTCSVFETCNRTRRHSISKG